MMKHDVYNTNLRQEGVGPIQVLFNEMEMPIARYDSGADVMIWSHSSIDANDAEEIVYEQLERGITTHHLQLEKSYDTFNFYSVPHAMAVASKEDSPFRNALKDTFKALKSLDNHLAFLKTTALNPSQFSIISHCPYCTEGTHLEDVALVSVGVPITSDERVNIHGRNGISIDHICRNCTDGVTIQ